MKIVAAASDPRAISSLEAFSSSPYALLALVTAPGPTALPQALWQHASASSGGFVFVIGGSPTSNPNSATNIASMR